MEDTKFWQGFLDVKKGAMELLYPPGFIIDLTSEAA
jgi:hypothetical protein